MKRGDYYALAAIFGISIILASLLLLATTYKNPGSSTAAAVPSAAATPAPSPTPGASYVSTATVTIPHADRFEPTFLQLAAGGTLTWTNQDTDAHTVASMPTDPVDFHLTVPPGGTATFTFMQSGVYGYYCDIHAMYDPATGLVKADKGTDAYPISMYGVVQVVDAAIPVTTGTAKVVVPGADRFQPLATTVKAGTTVAWTNIDSDPHSVYSTPGGPQQLQLIVQPNGKSAQSTFTTPGIYTYFCNLHATWNADLKRVQALPGTSEYPAAMEGVVFVLP